MGMSTQSKARCFLFREALHINKYLLNKPFPGHYPSCLPAGSVVWWCRGPQVTLCLFTRLPGSLELSDPPCEAMALADLPCGICCSNAEQLPAALPHLPAPTWANRFCVARRGGHMVTPLMRFAVELTVPGQWLNPTVVQPELEHLGPVCSCNLAGAQEVELKLPNYLLWECNFHKGQLRTKMLSYCRSLLCKTFCCFAKFLYISNAFPDVR